MQAINASNMNISGERKFTLLSENVLGQLINTVLLKWIYPFKRNYYYSKIRYL